MKKLFLASAILTVAFSGLDAQVLNRAIQFAPEGNVDCGVMPDLDNLKSYSIQLWFNPSEWEQDAVLISRGDNFSINLGEEGSIKIKNSGITVTAANNALKAGDWNQITVICDAGKTEVLVNGEKSGEGYLSELSKSDSPLIFGGKYTGLLDEVRLWDDALDETMKTFDYFTNNTLNKWCPMWENLVAYYKMDQENCPYLVDYKGIEENIKDYDNHGIMSQGVSRVEAFNDKMPYLINSAYTNNDRFFDRLIPRDQYLLSNELIILGLNTYAEDGRIAPKTPNNHATELNNIKYLPEFENREGVISFTGNSSMTLPSETFPINNPYTFETWIYIDEWTPGAYILRKENESKTEGIAIFLGNEDEKRIIARINGKEYPISSVSSIPVGEWSYLAFTPGNDVFLNEESKDFALILGENLKGKLDETVVWEKVLTNEEISQHREKVPLPGLESNVSLSEMKGAKGYYRYDDPEDLGFSSHSQDSWLKIMKEAYNGHGGVKFFISVQGTYKPLEIFGDWREILEDPTKRERFATDLAEISKNYDGVELDLEWIENQDQWNDYGVLAQEIREKLPEGKEFRISLHNNYLNFPADKMKYVDGFTFQQYGPNAKNFSYSNFEMNTEKFKGKFDRDKIMTSYATTTSKGENGSPVTGVRGACMKLYEPSEADADKFTGPRGDTWTYIGPMQVYQRAKYTRENNLQGIFYWDMGNDNWEGTGLSPVMPEYNQAKYCSYAINANNDKIVTDLKVKHYDGNKTEKGKE